MHPSVPFVKVLENVPRGHGNNIAIYGLLPSILVKPEAKRAEVMYNPLPLIGKET